MLLGSGIDVEVCHVTEKGAQPQVKSGRANKSKNKGKAKAKARSEELDNDVESEDETVPRRSISKSGSDVQAPEPSSSTKAKRKSFDSSDAIMVVDDSDDEKGAKVRASPASLKRPRGEVFIIGKAFPVPKKAKKSKTM